MKTQKTINHTKNLISFALVQLMWKKDYENITIKELCEKAGVSRMSFYRYYDNKEDIFIDFCDERFEEFYETYLNTTSIRFEDFILNLFTFFKKYNRHLIILRRAGKQQILLAQFNNYFKYLVSKSNSTVILMQSKNPVLGPLLAGGIYNVLMDWLDDGMEKTPEEMTKLILSVPYMIYEEIIRTN